MVELSTPDKFPHHIVAAEATDDCACNASHEEGDALWGGKIDPREYDTIGFEQVEDIHDIEVEYEHR